MNHLAKTFTLSACAVAASILISACGGAETADTVAPTVTISDSVAAATASGPVTFTFTFNEDVGTSFAAEDIMVTGGTAGTLTKVSATQYTLVVTPPSAATGSLAVSVAAAKFKDLALNDNTIPASAQQAFDTTTPAAPSGNTGTCTAAPCIDFSGSTVGFVAFEGLGSATVANDPVDATNKVGKLVKVPSGQPWAGATVFTTDATAQTVAPVGFATSKIITLRVYSPAVGEKIMLKVETGPNSGAANAMEKEVLTTKANEWETLSFDFASPTTGTYDPAKVYQTISIFPKFLTAVTADTTYYFDELKYAAATGGGGSGACAAPNCVDFSAAGIGFGVFENGGGGTAEVAAEPANAANKVVKFVKKPADGEYFGTTITGLGVSPVLTADKKTVTMRVFSPAVGTNFLLKFEGGTGGPAVTEKDAVTTKANEWETLSFVMPDTGTYSTIVVFPNGRSKVATDTTMYIDDLTFPATVTSGGGGGSGGFVGGVYADDYVGSLNPADNQPAKSTQGGAVGFFVDDRLFANKAYDYGGLSGTAQNPGGVPNFYYGLGLNAPAITDGYIGAYVKSPGNGVVNVASFTNLKVTVWGNDELFNSATFPQLQVILQGPAVAGCGSSSGGSEVTTTFRTTTQGAASVYTLPLSGFTVQSACSGETTAAQVLANIAQFNIVLKGTNIQYVRKDNGGVGYTNGLNVGPIKFN